MRDSGKMVFQGCYIRVPGSYIKKIGGSEIGFIRNRCEYRMLLYKARSYIRVYIKHFRGLI